MKVIGVTEFGAPDALRGHEVPVPHPRVGEVRIRVRAAAVNPTDTHVRCGTYDTSGKVPPIVPGMDAPGVVDEVGPDTPWAVGDELMGIALPTGQHGGAYTEYLVGPWDSMARVPAGTTLVASSTLPMNGLTAHQALEKLDLRRGQTLAVTGAAGTLGSYTVALAKRAGVTVVADASEQDQEWVESLGADHIVPRGQGVADDIRARFPDGVDAVVDTAVLDEKMLPAIADGGQLATVRFWEAPAERGITTQVVRVRDEYRSHAKLDFLRQRVEDSTLALRVADTVAADDAAEAHRRLEAGGVRGRLVLIF